MVPLIAALRGSWRVALDAVAALRDALMVSGQFRPVARQRALIPLKIVAKRKSRQ
jgi:hypothetical protein